MFTSQFINLLKKECDLESEKAATLPSQRKVKDESERRVLNNAAVPVDESKLGAKKKLPTST